MIILQKDLKLPNEISNVHIPVKKKNYVDNEKFYNALVDYKLKCDNHKKLHEITIENWKKACKPILKELRKEHPDRYKNFLLAKLEREKEGSWMLDIEYLYGLPPEPKFLYPRIPEYIGKCIYLIANGLSGYWQFSQYSYRDEMAADGIEDAILRIHSFNPERSKNAFAYFTQICYFAAVRRIKKEKRQKLVKSELVKNSGIVDSLSNNVQTGDDAEYSNQYLQFLLENVDNGPSVETSKETAQKMKRTTKAHQQRVKDKQAAEGLVAPTLEVEIKKPPKVRNKKPKDEMNFDEIILNTDGVDAIIDDVGTRFVDNTLDFNLDEE